MNKFGIPPTQMQMAYAYPAGIPAPVPSATEDKGEEAVSSEINENLDMDLGEDFDLTQSLLTQPSLVASKNCTAL